MTARWNDRNCLQGFPDEPVHFLGVVSPVHDIAFRFMEIVTFFQERECVMGIMSPAFRDHESGDNLLIDVDND